MENDTTVNIDGAKIRILREKQKVTQLYLATVVGVTTDTISRWENRRYPTIKKENALKLAEALLVPLDELLENPDEPEPPADPVIPASPAEPPPPEEEKEPLPPEFEDRPPKPFRLFPLLVPITCLGLALLAWLLFFKSTGRGISAIRHLPTHVVAGQPFPVLIEVTAEQSDATTLMLRETLPEECLATAAAPPFISQDKDRHLLKWIGKAQTNSRNRFAYLVKVTGNTEPGRQLSFAGNLIIGGLANDGPTVAGDQQTVVGTFHWADSNQDNRIDDYELLSAYELFPNFKELHLDMAEVERLWASGGYHWNSEKKTIEPNRE